MSSLGIRAQQAAAAPPAFAELMSASPNRRRPDPDCVLTKVLHKEMSRDSFRADFSDAVKENLMKWGEQPPDFVLLMQRRMQELQARREQQVLQVLVSDRLVTRMM